MISPAPVLAIGDPARTGGLALAGVRVLPATTPDDVRRQWAVVPTRSVVVLTPEAAAVLGQTRSAAGDPEQRLTVVLPT